MELYHLINPEVRRFMKGKTIKSVKVVRPDDKMKDMFESELNPQAFRIEFTDGTTLQIDTWIGNFKPKKHAPTDLQHDRQLAYLTAMTRGVDGLAMMPDELRKENEKRLGPRPKKKKWEEAHAKHSKKAPKKVKKH